MKTVFKKQENGIVFEASEISLDRFVLNDFCYCYEDDITNKEFYIAFRVKIPTEKFLLGLKIQSKSNRAYFNMRDSGFLMRFWIPKGKYAISKGTRERFYFYQETILDIQYSFKVKEIKESAFDYEYNEPKKEATEFKVKKERSSAEKRKLNRQKWILEHPFQGGAFSPR